MKKRIDKYIPLAMDLVNTHLLDDGKVKNTYNSYISNFGAAIISSGVRATVAFFSKDKDHRKLLQMLYEIVTGETTSNETAHIHINTLLDQEGDMNQKISKLMDAAAAIKLSIRTFKIDKTNG